jgi:hypothetical protein
MWNRTIHHPQIFQIEFFFFILASHPIFIFIFPKKHLLLDQRSILLHLNLPLELLCIIQ